jgi:hypothetical protein
MTVLLGFAKGPCPAARERAKSSCLRWGEQASPNVASQEASQRGSRRAFHGKCLIDQRDDKSSPLVAAGQPQQKTPNFRRRSEFSENLSASDSYRSRRVFITPLIQRKFFPQCMVRRCWPASCGVTHDFGSLTGKQIWQLEGNVDDQE